MKANNYFYHLTSIFLIFGLIKSLDISTLSNYQDITLEFLYGEFKIDFESQIVRGNLSYTFNAKSNGNSIILDTYKLYIKNIYDIEKQEKLNFSYGDTDENLGEPLNIHINYTKDVTISINIEYETTDEGSSAQFLTKEQTFGKEHPYFFTQSALILGRSLFPCQDTPAVKFKFNLAIIVPKPLRGMISGILLGEEDYDENYKKFNYKQEIPIPSYLVSFAAGNIIKKSITEIISIYTEPEYIDEAYNEVSDDLPIALKLAIDYMGPYEWGQYNILVLPRSFPYSGMENPCLSFLSPCLINGDKSLISIIFHEMIHSWSGNLVTNENWSDFWLNEGITMFLQRKIVSLWKNDKEYARMDGYVGQLYIKNALNYLEEEFTTLRPNLTGDSPENYYSDIPYEKGYNFIYYIEHLIGENMMEKFFKSYFSHFKYKSIDFYQFKEYFLDFSRNNGADNNTLEKINWSEWIFTPGDIPLKIEENNKYKRTADYIIKQIKNENFENLYAKFNDIPAISKAYILLSLEYFDGFLTEKQHKFLTETLELYQNQNFLVSTYYFRLILVKTDKFIEPEIDCLINYLSNYGASDYMAGFYESFYKRDEIKAQEILNSLKSFYHSIMFGIATEEIEYVKQEFPILELNVTFDKIYYYPYEDIFEINVEKYNNDFGELNLNKNIYLVQNESIKYELLCSVSNYFQFCKLKNDEELYLNGQFYINITERIQELNYAVKALQSDKFEIKQILNKENTMTNYTYDMNKDNVVKIIINLNEKIDLSLPVYFNNDKNLKLKCKLIDYNYECELNKTFCETHCDMGSYEEKEYNINVLSKSEKSFLNISVYIKKNSSEDDVKDSLYFIIPCVIGCFLIVFVLAYFMTRIKNKDFQKINSSKD